MTKTHVNEIFRQIETQAIKTSIKKGPSVVI